MNFLLFKFVFALCLVESGNRDYAIGDDGRSLGCLQVGESVLADVNAHYGRHFTRADCFNGEKSIEILFLYENEYCTAARIGHIPTPRDQVMTWHWGPNGWRHADTDGFWKRVEALNR